MEKRTRIISYHPAGVPVVLNSFMDKNRKWSDNFCFAILTWGIISFAFVLKWCVFPDAFFGEDQAVHLHRAIDYLDGENFSPLGPKAAGSNAFIPGPVYYLFLAGALILWKNPQAVTAMILILNTATLILWQTEGKRLGFSLTFRLLLIFLGAFNLATVLHSNYIWNPNFYYVWSSLIFIALLHLHRNPSSRWGLIPPLVISVAPQFHITFTVYFPVVVTGCLLFRVFPTSRWFYLGLSLAIAMWIPYLTHEWSNNFSNTRALWNAKSLNPISTSRGAVFVEALTTQWRYALFDTIPVWKKIFSANWETFFAAIRWTAFGALIVGFVLSRKSFRKSETQTFALALAVLVVLGNALFLTAIRTKVWPHYILVGNIGMQVLVCWSVQRFFPSALFIALAPWTVFCTMIYTQTHSPETVREWTNWMHQVERRVPEGTLSSFSEKKEEKDRLGALLRLWDTRFRKRDGDWALFYDWNKEPETIVDLNGSTYLQVQSQASNEFKESFLYSKMNRNPDKKKS